MTFKTCFIIEVKPCKKIGKIIAVHITGFPVTWIYHLMPFLMLFTNMIIASTLNWDLSAFAALKNDQFSINYDSSYNWLTNKANIPLNAFFYVLYKYNNCFYYRFKFKLLKITNFYLKYKISIVFNKIILCFLCAIFDKIMLCFLNTKIIYGKVMLG